MKKRWLALVLTALLPLAVACGGAGDTPDTTTTATEILSETTTATEETTMAETTTATTTAEEAPQKKTSVTFSVFSDFHYKSGMYISTIADMEAILARADASGAEFIIHIGDFCNDFRGSPELMSAYLDNPYDLPAYGVYGNHELESTNNSMQYVTPRLTNQKDHVVWGTDNGKIGDGSIAYYYYDIDGFRFICVDTNYSWNPTREVWEHNYTASYGAPAGNTKTYALGPTQLAWLERVLNDAADHDLACIIFGHSSLSNIWSSSSDAAAVQKLFKAVNDRVPGTVILNLNGHLHTNRGATVGGVVYLDINTALNGYWTRDGVAHYTTQTYPYKEYNNVGTEIPAMARDLPVASASQSKNTWFFEDPLSCIITVDRDGTVTVEGQKTAWLGGIVPSAASRTIAPEITSGVYHAKGKQK